MEKPAKIRSYASSLQADHSTQAKYQKAILVRT